MKNMHKRNIGT